MGDEFNAGKYGAILTIPFTASNIATNATATDLTRAGGTDRWVPPKSGSVIGISVRLSAAITAGTLSFRAHKDSTEFAQSGYPNPSLASTSGISQESYASIRPGVLVFSADEGVGISFASSTDMAPTNTNDVDADLFVQLDPN